LVVFAIGTLSQLFLPSYFASKIQTTTDQFVDDAMESEWIHGEISYKKNLVFLMQNVNRPNIIKVSKVFNLNLDTFQKVKAFSERPFKLIIYLHFKGPQHDLLALHGAEIF